MIGFTKLSSEAEIDDGISAKIVTRAPLGIKN
jgi:hypothetical protein